MKILVFQHIAMEHPGIFRDFFTEDGIEWDAVELDEGVAIPSLDGYDALWVMGGPMDVWQEHEHPWLVAEKAAIREAVIDRGMPFLGVCLGHQLLADALGGRVAPMDNPEVGILDIELTGNGATDPLLTGLPSTGKCLQWHSTEVVEPPPGAEVLARSAGCNVQALRVGRAAYSLQYHVELTATTVSEWGKIPAYEQALARTLGSGALQRLQAETDRHMNEFNRDARRLYGNSRNLLRRQQRRADIN